MTAGGFLSTDGSAATSVIALAAMLQVHRNRISAWRRKGGPKGLAIAEWRAWFTATGRIRLAAELSRSCVEIPADVEDKGALPSADVPTSDAEQLWRVRYARAKAETAEMALAAARGEVYRAGDVRRVLRDLTAATAEVLTQGIWTDLAPSVVCASPDLRRGLRLAHDRGMLVLRQKIIAACGEALEGMHP